MSVSILGAYSAQLSDIAGGIDLPSALGFGIVGPAMFWAYRTVSRSNEESKSEAWEIVERLKLENGRLQARIDRLVAGEARTDGGTKEDE